MGGRWLEDSRPDDRRGRVLHAAGADDHVVERRAPSGELAEVVSHLWEVRWDRPAGMPSRRQVLGDPVVHLTVEDTGPLAPDGARPPLHGQPMPATLVHGPVSRLWSVDLSPTGRTVGVGFRPGGFAALLDVDIEKVAGRVLPADEVVGDACVGLTRRVLAEDSAAGAWAVLERWLEDLHRPARERLAEDTAYRCVRRAVEIIASPEVVRVEQVAAAVPCAPRTLQRWFRRYVGLAPLQVVRRRRLQDAVAALDAGEPDLAALAVRLGWSDQAHLTRDFTAVLGRPPAAYRRGD